MWCSDEACDWLIRMGISNGGKSQRDVREQAERIARCRFTFQVSSGGRVGLVNQNIMVGCGTVR